MLGEFGENGEFLISFPIKTPTAMHSIKAEFLIAKDPC